MCANKMKKHSAEDNDPFRDLKEWQDHRYDPGYFTGGNIHPLLKARRPNKYGYVLILSGACILFLALFGRWYDAVLQIALALLMIAAGVKLAKGTDARPS
jgi:hypothetical protein